MEISGYNIVDTIGEGSIATVYLAIQAGSGQELALKVFSRDASSQDSFVEQFLVHSEPATWLKHPNIATVYDQGVDAGQAYLALEYVPGQTLRHRRFELGLPEQLQIVRDLALALEFLGQNGIVHGNIRLENIILHRRDGRPILTDLGMPPGSGGGADRDFYPSPEARRGAAVDSRTDIYSLGKVLLLLVCGQFPRLQADLERGAKVGGQGGAEWQLPPELAVFQPILTRALAEEAAERYQGGAEMVQALASISREQLQRAVTASEQALMRDGEASSPATARPTAERPQKSMVEAEKSEEVMETANAATGQDIHEEEQDEVGSAAPTMEVENPSESSSSSSSSPELPATANSATESMTAHSEDRIDLQDPDPQGSWGSIALWALIVASVATAAMLVAALG